MDFILGIIPLCHIHVNHSSMALVQMYTDHIIAKVLATPTESVHVHVYMHDHTKCELHVGAAAILSL